MLQKQFSKMKKFDLRNIKSGVDKLEKVPAGLNSLKSKVDKLHVDKLVPVAADLSELIDVVKNDVVKKTEYDKLVKKFHTI